MTFNSHGVDTSLVQIGDTIGFDVSWHPGDARGQSTVVTEITDKPKKFWGMWTWDHNGAKASSGKMYITEDCIQRHKLAELTYDPTQQGDTDDDI